MNNLVYFQEHFFFCFWPGEKYLSRCTTEYKTITVSGDCNDDAERGSTNGIELERTKTNYIPSKYDYVIKWKHFPRNWSFVRGIHRSLVNSPRKGQWRGDLMFSLICVWINDWVNNREAGDLRRNRAHYDVIVMKPSLRTCEDPCDSPWRRNNFTHVQNIRYTSSTNSNNLFAEPERTTKNHNVLADFCHESRFFANHRKIATVWPMLYMHYENTNIFTQWIATEYVGSKMLATCFMLQCANT